jgi:zinc transport system substrate-binding protein
MKTAACIALSLLLSCVATRGHGAECDHAHATAQIVSSQVEHVTAPTGAFRIVTSFYPVYIAARNIARDIPGVTVTCLTPPETGCLHHYQLTPDDLVALSQARVMVINGGGMEPFLDLIRRRMPELPLVNASAGIALIQERGGPNPHVWVSPSLAITQVWTITAGVVALDPAHAADYRRNATVYAAKLAALRERMLMELQSVTNRAVVTLHNAFAYFARDCGLDVVAVVQPEAGAQPNAREMAETIKTIRVHKVKAVFAEPQYSLDAANAIARETSAQVYILDPAASGAAGDDAYIETMQRNLSTLKQALE